MDGGIRHLDKSRHHFVTNVNVVESGLHTRIEKCFGEKNV